MEFGKKIRLTGKIFLFIILFNCITLSQEEVHHSFGVVKFDIPCSFAIQTRFNNAMILLHHMTYPQARELFLEAAEQDPECPMLLWGYTMTLFQPLWPTRPGNAELHQGWDAIQKAKLMEITSLRDSLLITAAEAFFRDPDSTDYWKRIRAWKNEMEKAYSILPDDNEIASFYSLSLLATAAPDQVSSPNNAIAADILLKVIKENPKHPGAMHYLIHANDTPGREKESTEILNKYRKVAPDNPHALHMPTHIFTRLGEWDEVIKGNLQAAEAALKYPAGAQGEFIWDEFPHALEYLIYAYIQTGNDSAALTQLSRLKETKNIEPTFKTAFHISSTRARFALERKAWLEAASIEPRQPEFINWDRFPWPEAISWYARGIGAVKTGNPAEAKKSLERLIKLEEIMASKKEVLFTRNIKVLRLELTSILLNEAGNPDSALVLLTEAAEIESSTPKHAVTPAPTIPAYELLGDILSGSGKSNEALSAYKKSLEKNPNRFNSLIGAARASIALGDRSGALSFYSQLIKISSSSSERNEIKEAVAFSSK